VISRIRIAMKNADALVTTKEPMATLVTEFPDIRRRGLLLSLNRTGLGGSVFEMDDRLVASPDLASRWGLDGAKFLLRIAPGSVETATQLEACGSICEECDDLDLPLIIEPLYCTPTKGGLVIDSSPEKIRYSAIIANDFCIPAIKIPYPEGTTRSKRRKDFGDIVGSVDSKVLILGGKKISTQDLLVQAEDSIKAGGSGVVIGRNILLHENPALVTLALRKIIHDEQNAETALRSAREVLED